MRLQKRVALTIAVIVATMSTTAKSAVHLQTETINLPERKPIVIAMIDTGFDPLQKDLRQMLWINPGETGFDSFGNAKGNNGIDDDGNGYTDDISGVDFSVSANTSAFPKDVEGHGTHVSGIIGGLVTEMKRAPAAEALIAERRPVRLMILKYYDEKATGDVNLRRSLEALEYAVDNDVDIINYSGGGNVPNAREIVALKRAQRKGILVIAAAGNDGADLDKGGFYPASYDLPNILAVAALGKDQKLHPKSNYGQHATMIAAPGEKIISQVPGGLAAMTGTSQATAMVTGVLAGMIAESTERRTPEAWIQLLLQSSEIEPNLIGKLRYPLKLNVERARRFAETIPAQDLLIAGRKGSTTLKIR